MNLADESNEFTIIYPKSQHEFMKRIMINNKKQHPSVVPICSCSPCGEDRLPLTSSLPN